VKKYRKEKQFLEELQRVPNISYACEKVGISRNTVYRWKLEDNEFKERVERCLSMGIESISDLAESCIIQNIKLGNLNAAKYWLENHLRKYYRPKVPLETIKPEYKGIESITVIRNSKTDEIRKD